MNKELIIEMAQKAGLVDWEISAYGNELKEFARLVAEHEREQCAKDCESINSVEDFYGERPELIFAEVIRERGNQ
jgi:aminoglycoside phosphotransferase (APT) family kinase protein